MQPEQDLLQMVAEDSERMRINRERNRARFPFMSSCVDALNAAGLGPVRVIFAEENGQRAGREPE